MTEALVQSQAGEFEMWCGSLQHCELMKHSKGSDLVIQNMCNEQYEKYLGFGLTC